MPDAFFQPYKAMNNFFSSVWFCTYMAKSSAVDAESGPQRMLMSEFLKYFNLFFISNR